MPETLARIAAPLLLAAVLGSTSAAHAQERDGAPGAPVAPLIVGGAGVVVVGLGGLFALRASSARDDAASAEEHTTAAQRADDARSLTNVANLMFLAGGAVLAVGAAWAAVELTSGDDGEGGTALLIGPGSLALRGRFD